MLEGVQGLAQIVEILDRDTDMPASLTSPRGLYHGIASLVGSLSATSRVDSEPESGAEVEEPQQLLPEAGADVEELQQFLVDDTVSEHELAKARFLREPDFERGACFGFVVAVTVTGLRRLHFVGNCGKCPGRHCFSFESHVMEMPPPTAFDKQCANWCSENPLEEDEEDEASADSLSSSTSSRP